MNGRHLFTERSPPNPGCGCVCENRSDWLAKPRNSDGLGRLRADPHAVGYATGRRSLLLDLLLITAAHGTQTLTGPFSANGTYTLLTNGGVEVQQASSVAADAATWSEWDRAKLGRQGTWKYAGSWAGGLVSVAGWTSGQAMTNTATTVAGQDYVLSGFLWRNGTNTGNVYLDLNDQTYVQLDGGNGDCGSGINVRAQWQFVSCRFRATGTSVTVRMVMDSTWGAGAQAAFDEVAITPVAAFVAPTSLDKDWDGYRSDVDDCNDNDAAVHPGVADAWYDGVDKNCDGKNDYDQDGDGDGALAYNKGGDCADTNAAIASTAVEVCNGVDDDCDLLTDGADAIDAFTVHPDADGDSFGSALVASTDCVVNPGMTKDGTDCDDAAFAVNPDAAEACNGRDDDCDGTPDDGLVFTTYYSDADGDGFGNAATANSACNPISGSVLTAGDCADADNSRHPGAVEVCDGVDQDCDGTPDDGLVFTTYYTDADADGYGVTSSAVSACKGVPGASTVAGDCADGDPTRRPGAVEVCDAVDQDCDGTPDDGLFFALWYADGDADGYGDKTDTFSACKQPPGRVSDSRDCDDLDPFVFPGAAETCDLRDENCNGLVDDGTAVVAWYQDRDKDGHGDPATKVDACSKPSPDSIRVGDDCDDVDDQRYPGAVDVPGDGIDQDCDGEDAVPVDTGDTAVDTDTAIDTSVDTDPVDTSVDTDPVDTDTAVDTDPVDTDPAPADRPWSAPVDDTDVIGLPGEACGCSTGRPEPVGELLLLALVALRRRRR